MRVMAERGLDTANVRLLKTDDQAGGGVPAATAEARRVTRQPGPGQFMLWELAR